jgi:large subunit ribosomal protein L15
MTLGLHNLQVKKGSRRKPKRVGRGDASGKGTYSGKGQKGQRSRSGASGFNRRGLNTLLHNTPKFKGQKRRRPHMGVVNVSELEKHFNDGSTVTATHLIKKGLISTAKNGVKILSQGDITKKITIYANAFSEKAVEKIEKAGGRAIMRKRESEGARK